MQSESTLTNEVSLFLEQLRNDKGFSENTIAAYGNDLSQLADYLSTSQNGRSPIQIESWNDLDPALLEGYMEYLNSRDYADSTIARKTAALKSFSEYLVSTGVLQLNPSEDISPPKVKRYEPRSISQEDIQRLLYQPRLSLEAGRANAQRDVAMLELLYSSGMRVSELVALDVEDINIDQETVRCPGKNDRPREVPVPSSTVSEIIVYLNDCRPQLAIEEEQSLFVNRRGRRLTRQGCWLILKGHAERAGIAGITPHTLRHSYAMHAIGNGVDLQDLQAQLGHVSITTTQVYRRLSDREMSQSK